MIRKLQIQIEADRKTCGNCRSRAYGGFVRGHWCTIFWMRLSEAKVDAPKGTIPRAPQCIEAEKAAKEKA